MRTMEQPVERKKLRIIEMAKKRRHLHLVEKLARGKSSTPTLSKAEIHELEKYEGDPGSLGIVDSQEKVAKIFGVSVRTIQHWVRDNMPVTPQGTYDVIEIRAWRMVRNQRRLKGKNKIDWEQKYREYKARLAELELKKVLGEVIDVGLVEKELIAIFTVIKKSFLSLGRQISPQLSGLDTRQICNLLDERIKEILGELSDEKIILKIKEQL